MWHGRSFILKNTLSIIGRKRKMFVDDLEQHQQNIKKIVQGSAFLILGGAGSIGQAVVKEIIKRKPEKLHVVDISENNLVELTRDIRNSFHQLSLDFKVFALDINSVEYDAFFEADGAYDFVLNMSALKHVRNEKDQFTLMRMISVNVLATEKTLRQSISKGVKKYFSVSTDKSSNPVNLMGATKKMMEMCLLRASNDIHVTSARFANVAFSDGSLLHGFQERINKHQPIAAPDDVRRYFITAQEAGELCLMAFLLGKNRDIFFPKIGNELRATNLVDIAANYIKEVGYKPFLCRNEVEAINLAKNSQDSAVWPLLVTKSDTTGEKQEEEFYTKSETVDNSVFIDVGVIKNSDIKDWADLKRFEKEIGKLKQKGFWTKSQLLDACQGLVSDLDHIEKGMYLDEKI